MTELPFKISGLRITIPPYEEIEEDLVIPAWPSYKGLEESQKLAADSDYIRMLINLTETRKEKADKAVVVNAIFEYLYSRQRLLIHSTQFREVVREKAMELQRDIAGGKIETESDNDLMYYCSKVLRLIKRL